MLAIGPLTVGAETLVPVAVEGVGAAPCGPGGMAAEAGTASDIALRSAAAKPSGTAPRRLFANCIVLAHLRGKGENRPKRT